MYLDNLDQVFESWSNSIEKLYPHLDYNLFEDTKDKIRGFLIHYNLDPKTDEFLFENIVEIIRSESIKKKFYLYIDDLYNNILTCMITKYVVNVEIMTLPQIVLEKIEFINSYEGAEKKEAFLLENYNYLKSFQVYL